VAVIADHERTEGPGRGVRVGNPGTHDEAEPLQHEAEARPGSVAAIRATEATMATNGRSESEPADVDALRAEVAGLREALRSRAVIEQAKGILIATAGCTPDEAFALLVRQSQHENRKLREVAGELVASKMRAGDADAERDGAESGGGG
jgi:hypothetical protein